MFARRCHRRLVGVGHHLLIPSRHLVSRRAGVEHRLLVVALHEVVAPQLGILHVVVVEPRPDTARGDLRPVGDEGHRMGRRIVNRLPRGDGGIVVAQRRPAGRMGRVEDARPLDGALEGLTVGNGRAVGVRQLRRRDEGVLAPPLIEEAERRHVVDRRRGGPHIAVEEEILGRGALDKMGRGVLRHPDVPAPDHPLLAVEEGQHRIAAPRRGLKANPFRGGVKRHPRNQPLGRGPEPVGAPPFARLDGPVEMLALRIGIGAHAIAPHIGRKGVDARLAHQVAVGRPRGAQVDRRGVGRTERLHGQLAARLSIGNVGVEPVVGRRGKAPDFELHLGRSLHLGKLRRLAPVGGKAGPEEAQRVGGRHRGLGPLGRGGHLAELECRQTQRLEIAAHRLARLALCILGPRHKRIGRAGVKPLDAERHRSGGALQLRPGRCVGRGALTQTAVGHTRGLFRFQGEAHRLPGRGHLFDGHLGRKRPRSITIRLAARRRKQGRPGGRQEYKQSPHILYN